MSKFATVIFAAIMTVGLTGPIAGAQTGGPAAPKATSETVGDKPTPSPAVTRPNPNLYPWQTFYLKNAAQASEANEANTALRNMLPADDKVFLIPNQNAIVVRASAEDLAIAQKLLNDLDRSRKNYRLTYTVTEFDDGKRVGTQHFAMVIVTGQQTKLKQGSKVPIATGSYTATATSGTNASPAGVQTQFTYLDIGMNFDATLQDLGTNGRLRFSVEQSSLAPETSGVGPQDPIVRQTSLAGEATLTPGKPMMLGSVDIPGSTRRLDIEAMIEQLP